MKNVSVAELRAQGYRVFVRHCRFYRFAFSIGMTVVPVSNDDPVTRSQINELAQQVSSGNQIVHFETLSRGGRTEVEVYNGDELIGQGIARCSNKDAYNKKIGRDKALGRALRGIGVSNVDRQKTFLTS